MTRVSIGTSIGLRSSHSNFPQDISQLRCELRLIPIPMLTPTLVLVLILILIQDISQLLFELGIELRKDDPNTLDLDLFNDTE